MEIDDKPVWLTETGSSASPTLTIRTDYPNNLESQAADIFHRAIAAYGHDDSLVMWHSYIGSPDGPDNDWRLYGIRTGKGEEQLAYAAMDLLIEELIPFVAVELIDAAPEGINAYRITTQAGDVKHVV